jgi:hypothetical protein
MKNLTILLAIPVACLCGYALWRLHVEEPVENGILLEPGDAPELEGVYVDSLGAVPHRYSYFRPGSEHP